MLRLRLNQFLFLSLSLCVSLLFLASFEKAEASTIVLGGDRPARLYIPAAADSQKTMPLILFLHGYGVTGPQVNFQFSAARDSNKLGYLALIPDGQPDVRGKNFWNATPECCNFYGSERDDVVYLSALIEEAKKTVAVGDIYLFGHSNGGFMANRMACERPELFKGIISVAGGLYKDVSLCKNPGQVPFLQIHGTADTTIPYASNESYSGALETVQNWAQLEGCKSSVSNKASEDLILFGLGPVPSGNETDSLVFDNCSGGSKVGLWTVNGGSHVNLFSGLVKKALGFFVKP